MYLIFITPGPPSCCRQHNEKEKNLDIIFPVLCIPNLISMHLDRYVFKVSPDYFEYEFYSQGPRGRIKKIVRFDPFETDDGQPIINLAFGDWNEQTRSIDDGIATNNEDADKVLAKK